MSKKIIGIVSLVALVVLEVGAVVAYYAMHDAVTSRILMGIVFVGVLTYDIAPAIIYTIRLRKIRK